MRTLAFVLALAACGSSNSGSKTDANGNGDGNGGGGDTLGGNPTSVTVTLTNHPNTAATYTFIAAYQDGASAWQPAPTPSGDTYTFTINSPVWGFAWTCYAPNLNLARVELAFFTTAEKTSLTETVPNACTDRGTMNVGVSGTLSNTNGGIYLLDYVTRTRNAMANGTFALEGPPGAHDLFATHLTATTTTATIDETLRSTATAPQTGIALDWNNAAATANATATLPTGATASSALYSAGGTQVTLGAGLTQLVGLDSTQAVAGDIYDFASTTRAQGSTETSEIWSSTVAAQTFTAPTPLGGATSSVPATTPYPIIMTTWDGYANANGYIWDARQGAGGGGGGGGSPMEWTAIIGPGYVGSMPRFQMPDLSMVSGWAASLQLQTGQMVQGTVVAETSSLGATDFPNVNPPASGTTRTIVTSGWTVTP